MTMELKLLLKKSKKDADNFAGFATASINADETKEKGTIPGKGTFVRLNADFQMLTN